ncbi:MAG: hypothetical protein ACI9VM_001018 [Candidatus Azotimanducaceae bacterium]|jgi:hypothetical protein
MKLNSFHYFIIFLVVVVVGLITARVWGEQQPGKFDELAQCITNSGATFYGAFWCSHCEEQRNMFGNSAKLLPYVECSTPDRNNQTQACIDAEIVSYPTWDLSDGTRIQGVQAFADIADATGCEYNPS